MSNCPKPTRGVAARLTELDECGNPLDYGADENQNSILVIGYISFESTPDIYEANRFQSVLADGTVCVDDNFKAPQVLGHDLSLEVCALDANLLSMLVGGTLIPKKGDPSKIAGYASPGGTDNETRYFSLELWMANTDRDCNADGSSGKWIRFIYPGTYNWTHDQALTSDESNRFMLSLSGYAKKNNNWRPILGENDPDWDATNLMALDDAGVYAWVCTDYLPPVTECGDWATVDSQTPVVASA